MRTLRMAGMFAVIVGIAAALSLTVVAATIDKDMDLRETATVGGKQLEPDLYRIKITDDGSLTVKHGKEIVAEAKGEWVETKIKPQGDTFIVEAGQLKEIRIDGKSKVWKAK